MILAAPRSGSNMLSSLLNSHTAVLCHHELYNPNGIFYALPLRGTDFQLAANTQQRDQAPLAMLSRVWANHLGHDCVGFKMTHRQNQAVFHFVLNDTRVKKIVLKRRNEVKTHVSKLIAEQSGVWEDYGVNTNSTTTNSVTTSRREEELTPANNAEKVTVNMDLLQQDVAFNRAFYQQLSQQLSASKQTYLEVHYECLVERETHKEILDYLQLPYQALTTPSRKQNPTDVSQKISNYQSLINHCHDPALLAQLTELNT